MLTSEFSDAFLVPCISCSFCGCFGGVSERLCFPGGFVV